MGSCILFRGRDKTLYSFKQDLLLLEFKKKPGEQVDSGILRVNLSEYFFSKINSLGINTHFIKKHDTRSILIKETEVFPITFRIRNRVTEDISLLFGRNAGEVLEPPVIDYFFHQQGEEKKLIPKDYVELFNIIEADDLDEIEEKSLRINDVFSGLFSAFDLDLWCLDLRWGKYYDTQEDEEKLLLCDEISAENFFIYDAHNKKIVSQFAEDDLLEQNKTLAKRLKMMIKLGEK